MDTEAQSARQRKSLAVDQKTYDLLQEICFEERRTRIEQLKILIEQEHKRIFGK
jgi:ferritin-like protein